MCARTMFACSAYQCISSCQHIIAAACDQAFSVGAAVLFFCKHLPSMAAKLEPKPSDPAAVLLQAHTCLSSTFFLYFQVWNIILCAISSGRACADGGAWWADAGPKFHVTGSGERQGAIHHKSLPLSTTCFSTNAKQPESFTSCSFHHLSAVCGLVEAGCYWVAIHGWLGPQTGILGSIGEELPEER